MSRPKLLDLFCCAGGAARGYDEAGFDVFGVDIVEQSNYPYPMIVDNALELSSSFLKNSMQSTLLHHVSHTLIWQQGIETVTHGRDWWNLFERC